MQIFSEKKLLQSFLCLDVQQDFSMYAVWIFHVSSKYFPAPIDATYAAYATVSYFFD